MKDVEEGPIVQGKEFNVTHSVHNVGDTTAMNIVIKDSWPKDKFERIHGKAGIKIKKILPGGKVNHVFTLKPNDGAVGPFIVRAAKVEYSWTEFDEEADTEETMTASTKSSTVGSIEVLDAAKHLRETSQYVEEWTVFGGFSCLAVAMPFFVWRQKSSEFHASGKRK